MNSAAIKKIGIQAPAALLRLIGTESVTAPSHYPADATGHTVMPLSQMKPGEQGHVLDLRGEPQIRQHLLELGFTSGTSIEFIRVAPLSDPLTVRIRGYQLSLRRREADSIWVRRCPPEYPGGLG